jgi:hypothetical protein
MSLGLQQLEQRLAVVALDHEDATLPGAACPDALLAAPQQCVEVRLAAGEPND